MDIYFQTGGKPSQEVLDAIHSIESRKWDKELQAWKIDDSEKDKLPLDKMPDVKFYASKEEILNSSQIEQPEVQKQQNNTQEESTKKEMPPELKEAFAFKEGWLIDGKKSENLSVKALYAYVHNLTSFYASAKYKGNGDSIRKNIEADKLLNKSFMKTQCASMERKIPDIMKIMIAEAKDQHLTNIAILKNTKNLEPENLTRSLKKSAIGLHSRLDEQLKPLFPKNFIESLKTEHISSKTVSPGKQVAEDFLAGKTKDLTYGALKSHVMSFANQALESHLDDKQLKDALDNDKILNADLSKTQLKDFAKALPKLKDQIFTAVQVGQTRLSDVNDKFANKEINENDLQISIRSIKYRARIEASQSIPNQTLIDNQKVVKDKKPGNELLQREEDLVYIVSKREAQQEHETIKSIEGYSYNKTHNYWTVPKAGLKGIEAIKGMEIYNSYSDLKQKKPMSNSQLDKLVGTQKEKVQTNSRSR